MLELNRVVAPVAWFAAKLHIQHTTGCRQTKGVEKEIAFQAIELLRELLNLPLDLRSPATRDTISSGFHRGGSTQYGSDTQACRRTSDKLGRLKPVLHGTIRIVLATEPVNAAVRHPPSHVLEQVVVKEAGVADVLAGFLPQHLPHHRCAEAGIAGVHYVQVATLAHLGTDIRWNKTWS